MTLSDRMRRGWAVGMPLVVAGLIAGTPRSPRPEAGTPNPDEFQRAIAARDTMILDLLRRVEALEEDALLADLLRRAGALEHAVAATVTEPTTTPIGTAVAALAASEAEPVGGGGARDGGAVRRTAAAEGGGPAVVPTVGTEREPESRIGVVPLTGVAYTAVTGGAAVEGDRPPGDGGAVAAARQGPEGEPGDDDGGLDRALRALERTLVQEGGLLLPEWAFEVSSEISYTYDSSGGLRFVGGAGIVDRDIRRDTLENSASFRLGLPWSAQAEVRVPYITSDEQIATAGLEDRHGSGSGLGDIEIGLTRQLLWESDVAPDVLGTVRWKAPTGESSFDVEPDKLAVGSGFHAVAGQLTAVKSREPLVFFGSLSYTGNLPDRKNGLDVNPGDTIGLSLGSILAAGPGTSLRSGLDLSFSRETEVNGREVPGSDGVSAMLELGASAVLPFAESRSLISVTAGVGVTDDAPDLQLEVSLPYRF